MKTFKSTVSLSPKISDAVKGKLSLGARILQVGGMKKVFKHLFGVSEKERLIKASQCYLSTTAGPIAGILFVSTEKVAFCSERTIKLSCPNGKSVRVHYKVNERPKIRTCLFFLDLVCQSYFKQLIYDESSELE